MGFDIKEVRESWRPDWRDATQYPDPETTSMAQWAWEFLRRNAEYQKYFVDSVKAMLTSDPSDPTEQELPRKYGLARMVDPAEPFSEKIILRNLGCPHYAWYHPENPATVALTASEPGDVVMKFNVRYPLAAQVKWAKHILERFRALNKDAGFTEPIDPRAQIRKYPFYLQLLDARAAGVSAREIAKAIVPGADDDEKNPPPERAYDRPVYDGLDAARKLSREGYRYLLLSAKIRR